jgi:hypothetical protein
MVLEAMMARPASLELMVVEAMMARPASLEFMVLEAVMARPASLELMVVEAMMARPASLEFMVLEAVMARPASLEFMVLEAMMAWTMPFGRVMPEPMVAGTACCGFMVPEAVMGRSRLTWVIRAGAMLGWAGRGMVLHPHVEQRPENTVPIHRAAVVLAGTGVFGAFVLVRRAGGRSGLARRRGGIMLPCFGLIRLGLGRLGGRRGPGGNRQRQRRKSGNRPERCDVHSILLCGTVAAPMTAIERK